MNALLNGLSQIGYILLLLALLLYVYANAGIMFAINSDPWNFSTLDSSLLAMIKVLTLDSWGDQLYTLYYGCSEYPGAIGDLALYTPFRDESSTEIGGRGYCPRGVPQPILATVFYVSFIFLASFGILSSVIGVVGYNMERCILRVKEKEKFHDELTGKTMHRIDNILSKYTSSVYQMRCVYKSFDIIKNALAGKPFVEYTDSSLQNATKKTAFYNWCIMSHWFSRVAYHPVFDHIVTMNIFFMVVVVGFETSPDSELGERAALLEKLQVVIQTIFAVDCLAKLLSEIFPWTYFSDPWNVFDFALILLSFIPLSGNSGNVIILLRLARLVRLLKLMKRFPKLQMIVRAFSSCIKPIILVTLLTCIWLCILAAIGMALFASNDPIHFGDFLAAFVTMFQIMTLDSWSSVMFINMYGCDVYGYSATPQDCVAPSQSIYAAALFFNFSMITLCWLLMSMFIGVLMTRAEQAGRCLTIKK